MANRSRKRRGTKMDDDDDEDDDEKDAGVTTIDRRGEKCPKIEHEQQQQQQQQLTINDLPVEMILEIFSYLSQEDLDSLRKVSRLFERVVKHPGLWRAYEIREDNLDASNVIAALKRMPLLRKFTMSRINADSDKILAQLSLSNKKLEELYIFNYSGPLPGNNRVPDSSSCGRYLQSSSLSRILERCRRLHTIYILGIRFRGCKFYRILGGLGLRLKVACSLATLFQFRTFIKHAVHICKEHREAIYEMCEYVQGWKYFRYHLVQGTGQPYIHINYLYSETLPVDLRKLIEKQSNAWRLVRGL